MQAPDPNPHPLDHLTLRGARDAPALVTREGTLDFAGLEQAVGALAAALLARGLAPGDRVASWLAKTRLAAVLPLACARAGLIHVPTNPVLKRGQIAHILADSGARLLIAGAGRLDTLTPDDVPEGCDTLLEGSAAALSEGGRALPPSAARPDDLAALLYTSGSTGRPKGVMLSHANLWLGAISVAHYLRLAPADRVLGVLPLSFDYGQSQLLSTWAAGGCAVPIDYAAPRDVVRAVERHAITTLAGVPPLWVQLVEAEWPDGAARSLRRLTNSGGRLPVSIVRRLREIFPAADLHLMYGLTEAFRSTSLDPALADTHPDSIGEAVPFAEIAVVGTDAKPVPDGQIGELIHAGPLVSKGYWNDTERTKIRFKPTPFFMAAEGLALWSGDRVRRDAGGLLYFVGRDDEMIKTSGNRVSPTEVEEAAMASGLVAGAIAFGAADDRLGERIVLAVRPSLGEDRDGAANLRDYLRRELPNFMQPSTIIWRSELPLNPNGKIDRARLKDEFMA